MKRYDIGRAGYWFRRIMKSIWIRASLFSVAAVVVNMLAAWVAPAIPPALSLSVGSEAVGNILSILASSMLAVTTFALSATVTAYGAATNTVTPRATRLLAEDRFTQNALSTFVGTFLFSIVGIIALATGFYGAQGRVVLFAATVVIIVIIAITLLRWIQHLSRFGRVGDTIARVERAATDAMVAHAEAPSRGGRPAIAVPADAHPVFAGRTGYVRHVDIGGLGRWAEKAGATVHVAAMPGVFVHDRRAVVRVEGAAPDADACAAIARCYTIAAQRDFDHDPRFGMIVLAEIASRALSPATNDSGTAIDVLGAAHRVFAALATTSAQSDPPHDCAVHVPLLDLEELFVDFFRPIARDGSGIIEVQLRFHATLAALAALDPVRFGPLAVAQSRAALVRAEHALDDQDFAVVREVALGVRTA